MSSTYREALETELAALIERDKPKERLDAVRAEIAKLDPEPVVETAAVAAPENAARPTPKPKPRK